MTYQEYEQKVIELVEELGHHPWFRGACLTTTLSDYENNVSLESAVEYSIDRTITNDHPDGSWALV